MTKIKTKNTRTRGPLSADPDKFNAIAKTARLELIQMNSCAFEVKPSFFIRRKEVKLAFERNVVSVHCDSAERSGIGFFHYSIVARIGREQVLKCHSRYMVAYEVETECDSEAFEVFCERTGMLTAYAYFRALVANLASSANVDLPPLPMVNFQPMRKPASSDNTLKGSEPTPQGSI